MDIDKFNFRCCAKKQCSNILHQSCLNRDHKSHIKLNNSKKKLFALKFLLIVTNSSLKNTLKEYEELKQLSHNSKLIINIEELECRLADKDADISELNKHSHELEMKVDSLISLYNKQRSIVLDFTEEALATERKLIDSLEEKSKEVARLNEKLSELKSQVVTLQNELQFKCNNLSDFKREMDESNNLNKEMVTTIHILEMENSSYLKLRKRDIIS